jgi:hypothetical protein
MQKPECFPSKNRTRQKVYSHHFYSTFTRISNKHNKKLVIKLIQIKKKEVRLLIFSDDIKIYENLMKSTIVLLEIISEFSKFAGYRINSHAPVTNTHA